MNTNVDMLTRNLNALIYKYNQLAIKRREPTYMRPLLPPNIRINQSMLRFEYGLILRKLKRLLYQEDNPGSGSDDTRVQSVDMGVTIEEFKNDADGITVGKWTYSYEYTPVIVAAQYAGIAEGELELKLSDMPAETCIFTGGESLSVDGISFSGCSDLTKLTLHDWDLRDIDTMNYMFAGCSSMITIDGIQNWDTSKVEDMNLMFYGCSDLSEFGTNTWDTSNVKRMIGAFQECASLTKVDGIQNWDTSNVETLGNMFNGCKELTAIDLSKWDTSHVSDATNMLLSCDKLESLTINSSVYDTFMSATNLGIDLDSWYYLSTSVGSTNSWSELGAGDEAATIVPYQTTILRYDGLFESLSTDIISGSFKYFFTTDITGSGQVFNAQLVDALVTTPPTDAPYMVIQDNNNTLVPVASYAGICENAHIERTIDVSKWNTRNVNDLRGAFDTCRALEKIDGLDKWNTSKVEDMSYMFANMDELTTLNGIQDWDTGNVEDMSYMFAFLAGAIWYFPHASKWDTSNLRNVSGMFEGASSINALMLNSWVVSEELDTTNMFKDMPCLHELTITESMFNRIRTSTDSGIAFTDWYYGSTKIGPQTWSELGLSTPVATFTKYIQNEKKLDGEFNYVNPLMYIDDWRYTGSTYDKSKAWQYLSVEYLGKTNSTIPTEKPYTSIRALDNTALIVASANAMFMKMTSLTTADMSSWSNYMSQVNIISNLFAGCTSLTSANVTGLCHSNMTDASFVFTDCTALTNIIGLDTWMIGTGMRSLNGFFNACSSLTQINGLSTWDISSVTEMYVMFNDCGSLESLDLSGWRLADRTMISGIFSGCTSLTSIRLKETAARLLTEFPGEITDWKVNGVPLTDTNWDAGWGAGPIEFTRAVA